MNLSVVNADFWRGKRVVLTGHTGFKGSWLSLWLQSMGADIHGLALAAPTIPNLYGEARVGAGMTSTQGDVRDFDTVRRCFMEFRPQIVIHMAAQSLVRQSYRDPVSTYATNVMGTLHVLEAARAVDGLRAIVNVTTDKCYENRNWVWGYREDEPMGGADPYSSSKGCSELLTSSYRRSFLQHRHVAVASARAGNVIGGGDWAVDRLVPDVLRAFEAKQPVLIRNPNAVRPWQHVLEPLSGYLMLAQHLFTDGSAWAEGWNFGPRDDDARPVRWIVERMVQHWGGGAQWVVDDRPHPHEAHCLKLDISKVSQRMNWLPRWTLGHALEMIVEWHQAWLAHEDMREMSLSQIAQYMSPVVKDSV